MLSATSHGGNTTVSEASDNGTEVQALVFWDMGWGWGDGTRGLMFSTQNLEFIHSNKSIWVFTGINDLEMLGKDCWENGCSVWQARRLTSREPWPPLP